MTHEPKWTNGPWKVYATSTHFRIRYRSLDHNPYLHTVAVCWPVGLGGEAYGPSFEQSRANANLIAAAPKLYEALDDLLHAANFSGAVGKSYLDAAENALASARGETE